MNNVLFFTLQALTFENLKLNSLIWSEFKFFKAFLGTVRRRNLQIAATEIFAFRCIKFYRNKAVATK